MSESIRRQAALGSQYDFHTYRIRPVDVDLQPLCPNISRLVDQVV
ncbi:MAG: hypothetical protein ACKVHE_24600 [Planctomycetales bacterium]